MERWKLNYIIEALMFLCLMAIAGLGFLMKYVMPPGRERWVKYGRNVDLSWLGLDRHDWGQIHLYLAFLLLALLLLHIILHWSQIVGLYGKLIAGAKARSRLAIAFLVIAVLLIYFPFLITPKVMEQGRGPGAGGGKISTLSPQPQFLTPDSQLQGRSSWSHLQESPLQPEPRVGGAGF